MLFGISFFVLIFINNIINSKIMVKIIKKIILSILLILSISVTGQTKAGTDLNDLQYLHTGGMWVKNNTVSEPIKGSPYLFETWNNDSKIFTNDRIYKISSLNFNIAKERFEAKFSEDSVLVISTSNINKIVINNIVLKPYYDNESDRFTFFEEVGHITNGKILKKYVVKIKEGNFNPMTQKKISPDRYVNEEYLYVADNETKILKRLKLKKSAILNLIDPENKQEILEFVKRNKLKYSNISDVYRILDYQKSIEI